MSNIQKPFSILMVIPSLHGGGAERVAVNLAEYWHSKGYRVVFLTQTDASSDVYPLDANITRVSTHQFGQTGPLAQLRKILSIRHAIRYYRPDVVIGIMMSASVLSIIAGMGTGVPVIATEHAHPPSQRMTSFWQKLRQWAYPHAAKVIALTEMSADWLRQHIPHCAVGVIPNAIKWPLQVGEPFIAVHKPEGEKYLLAVGRLHPEKGFDVLLKAFSLIAPHYPQWQLIILGEGPQREVLSQQIEQLGLSTQVQMPGRVGNLKDWYAQADLFVLSSPFEGMSNSLQEAMASGVCPVSFDCDTGPREIIREGVDGILVRPVSDAEALAQALTSVMQDDCLRQRYAQQAPEVIERFSMEKIGQVWESLFKEIKVKK